MGIKSIPTTNAECSICYHEKVIRSLGLRYVGRVRLLEMPIYKEERVVKKRRFKDTMSRKPNPAGVKQSCEDEGKRVELHTSN